MELISSMLNIVKNVSDTDREFKLLREKLVFNIKKGDASLQKYKKQSHYQAWVGQHLDRRLKDARQKLTSLDSLLSSKGEGISLKEKFKLSLPFNNERDKINQIIDDLKTAIDEVLNNNIPINENSGIKKKLQLPKEEKEIQIDNEIDQIYEMGPTIQENNAFQFAQQYTKNHTIELTVQALGDENILKVLDGKNKRVTVEHTCERASKQSNIKLFKLGRLNFKPEYKALKQVYPDIDKISKEAHFTVKWMRATQQIDKSQISQASNKKGNPQQQSQKKEQGEQFFSVPQVEHTQIENGQVILEKEKRSLYKKRGEGWVKVQQEWFEVSNGEEVAVCLGKDQNPELFFKINYQWK